MKSPLLMPAATLLLACLAATGHAGPNWQAIETARSEKQQLQEEAMIQQSRHDKAMQKLSAACDKAQGNTEVQQACREMMAACQEMM